MLSSPSTPLRLSIGACSLSSTTKLPWANEDAQFVAGNYCGVFDGVSALPASRAYARRLSSLTRSTLSRLAPDAAAWKGTAVSALQAAARGANSLDGASTAALACVDLERRQLSTYVLGDSGWLLFAPSASGRRLCARSSPQLHRVGTPACPYGNAGVAISSPGCSPKGVGRCSCIAAWDTQVRRSSSGQSCVAVARPSRAPPSEAPPAGRGGLARFTCGWHSLSEGNLAAIWPRAEPPPLASAGTSWWAGAGPSDQIHPPQASHRPSLCCRAPCSSCAPLSAPPLLRPLLRTPRTPITKPHPAPAPNPPLRPARAPIGALAASPSAHIRRRAAMACAPTHVHATQAHRRSAWQSRPRRDRGARRARCGARPSRACAPPSLRRARTAAATGRRNGRRSPPRRTREHRRRVERGRVGCYGAARPRRSLRAAAWRLVKQPRQPSPFIRPE